MYFVEWLMKKLSPRNLEVHVLHECVPATGCWGYEAVEAPYEKEEVMFDDYRWWPSLPKYVRCLHKFAFTSVRAFSPYESEILRPGGPSMKSLATSYNPYSPPVFTRAGMYRLSSSDFGKSTPPSRLLCLRR